MPPRWCARRALLHHTLHINSTILLVQHHVSNVRIKGWGEQRRHATQKFTRGTCLVNHGREPTERGQRSGRRADADRCVLNLIKGWALRSAMHHDTSPNPSPSQPLIKLGAQRAVCLLARMGPRASRSISQLRTAHWAPYRCCSRVQGSELGLMRIPCAAGRARVSRGTARLRPA